MSQNPTTPAPVAAPVIPAAPRLLTAAARRRAWAEMPVRRWCVLAAALIAVIIYLTITGVISSAAERALVLNGIPVDAVILDVGGNRNPDKQFPRNESLPVKVHFTLPDDQNIPPVPGTLSNLNQPQTVIHPGDHIALRVDRNDWSQWTDRTEPRSWFAELSVVVILLPVVVLLLVIAVLQRARILRIWRNGDAAAATVVETRQTALAPLSRLLRFTLNDGSSSRVCSVLAPTRAGVPSRGETIWLVMPRGLPERAVLAKLYM